MRKWTFAPALWATTALLLSACSGGGGGSSNPPANNPPVASAGSNQAVTAGDTVTLNGSGTDSDGTVTNYTWTQTAGTAVTLSSNSAAQPTFPAPSVAAATTLTFSLVVRDNRGASSTASTVSITVNPLAAGTLSGRVSFMRIPVQSSGGLNYASQVLRPARGIQVRAMASGTQNVLATATTNDAGDYSMSVAANTNVTLVVVAHLLRDAGQPLPRWNFAAQDADAANPTPYTYTDGSAFNSNVGTGRNVDIPSGISATGTVTGTRASAPFAVLDTVYQSMQLVLSVAPTTNFPELVLDWAASNPGGETYFMSEDPSVPDDSDIIVLSAEVALDTDEFDQHVIAHEFGHYVEYNFSRSDNIGGSHSIGDKLDVRVAFGEGFGYAFSAIVLNDPLAVDTFVFQGGNASSTFDVEVNPPTTEPVLGDFGCWCSESSVWSILWDVYDNTPDANDTLNMGFQPMWNVLVGPQRTTPAFTSLFSFISALKTANAGSAPAIDTLVTAQNTTAIADIWGAGESHVPAPVPSAAALPLYTNYGNVGGPAVTMFSVDDAGTYNKLGNHRFVRFNVATRANVTVTATSSNPNQADTDFLVWHNGELVAIGFDVDTPPAGETEIIPNADPGTYVIDVYDCGNVCYDPPVDNGDYNLTVTVN